jgi:uncharacterized membrane protein YtjA (UPF0391 family)
VRKSNRVYREKVRREEEEIYVMLGWAIAFLVIALIAAVFGFGGIAATAAGIAKILFVIFLILFVVSIVVHVVRGRAPPPAL